MEIDPYFQRCIILVHSLKRAQNNFRIQIIDRALGTRSSILKNGLGTRYFFQDGNEERNAFTKSVERNVFPFLVPRSFLPMHFREKKNAELKKLKNFRESHIFHVTLSSNCCS